MIRAICNYFRGCTCKHEFQLLAKVNVKDSFFGDESTHYTYRCKKCGFVKRVRL